MSTRTRTRPLRTLAAWGYESSSSGTRVEVDVWTVNQGEKEVEERPTPDDFDAAVTRVLDHAGDVAKVEYAGAAGEGYRRVSTDEPVSQQAFAGSKRAAGGERTDAGTFEEGYTPPVDAPTIDEVVRHGEQEILPVVREEMRELGKRVGREPSRDEIQEPVSSEPFEGFENVVRVLPGGGGTYRYRVDTGMGVLHQI